MTDQRTVRDGDLIWSADLIRSYVRGKERWQAELRRTHAGTRIGMEYAAGNPTSRRYRHRAQAEAWAQRRLDRVERNATCPTRFPVLVDDDPVLPYV
jgi:hypothetical protein